MTAEEKREYNRAYREKNREIIAFKRHLYYLAHRDKALAQQREYREKHKEKIKLYLKEYREKNHEKIKAYRKFKGKCNGDCFNCIYPDCIV